MAASDDQPRPPKGGGLFLEVLSAEAREQVAQVATRRRFRRGEIVVGRHEAVEQLHLVLAGRIAVHVGNADGPAVLLDVSGPGDYVGVMPVFELDDDRRSESATALSAAETLSIPYRTLHRVRAAHPAVDRLFVALLARRVSELSSRLVDALHEPLAQRVQHRLDALTRCGVRGATGVVDLPVTQEQLAEMVGATRPAVNAVLQTMREEGTVVLGRGRIGVTRPSDD